MVSNEEELKYKQTINTLKQLQKVKAPAYFEANLMRKIRSGDLEEKKQNRLKIFTPSKLIPSAALALLAIILLFVVNINTDDVGNPLLSEPRVRQDMISLNKDISNTKVQKNTVPESGYVEDPGNEYSLSEGNTGAVPVSRYTISKSGLNFRQINLNRLERTKLNELKAKLMRHYGK